MTFTAAVHEEKRKEHGWVSVTRSLKLSSVHPKWSYLLFSHPNVEKKLTELKITDNKINFIIISRTQFLVSSCIFLFSLLPGDRGLLSTFLHNIPIDLFLQDAVALLFSVLNKSLYNNFLSFPRIG